MYAPREEKHPEQRTFSMTLYMLVSFCGIAQYFTGTIVLGLILLVLCFFMTKAQRATAQNTIYATHVEWTRRTLSIGTFFLFPAALLLAAWLVWTSTDLIAMKERLDNAGGDIGDMINLVKRYVTSSRDRVEHITSMCMLPVEIWWLRRCIHGFVKASESEPIFFPEGIL